MIAQSITGFSLCNFDAVTLKASVYAGLTVLTGLTVSLAHVRVKNIDTSFIHKKINSLSRVYINHVNHVNPVKHQYSCGFQRIRVVGFVCKILLTKKRGRK